MKSISLLFILLCFGAALHAQQRLYVSPSALGANTGASWADAFTNLHTALVAAQPGDEIWVQAGIYFTSNTNDRNVYFQLPSGVALYGGFSGQESSLSARDWQNNPTIFDGNIGNLTDSTDNTYNLLLLVTPDSNTIVDGLTFRNAVANKPGLPVGVLGNSGAAIFIDGGETEAFAKIRNCLFEKNTALRRGGAVFASGFGQASVAPVFENCWFLSNKVSGGLGGAIAKIGASWVDMPKDIYNCSFIGNSAGKGGGIFIQDDLKSDEFNIDSCKFELNRKTDSGNFGGSVIHIWNPRLESKSIVSIKNSEIKKNRYPIIIAESFTEGVGNLSLILDKCKIIDNVASPSPSDDRFFCQEFLNKVSVFAKNISIINDRFDFIMTTKSPSDLNMFVNIYVENSSFTVACLANNNILDSIVLFSKNKDNRFNYNVASTGPHIPVGNIHIKNLLLNNVSSDNINFTLASSNCTIHGSTFKGSSFSFGLKDSLGILNCVFSNSTFPNPGSFLNSSTYIFKNSLFTTPDTIQYPNWFFQNNLWSTDPLFINPAAGDFRLQNCSPAINAGDNSVVSPGATDLDGRPRILGGRVDIGAYEHPGIAYAGAPEAQGACAGVYAGRVLFSPQEGCPPYSYAWQRPSDGSSGTRLDSLLPGEYLFSITDSRGQELIDTVLLPESIPPSIATVSAPAQCGSNGGSISVQPSGGTPPFVYNWSDAPGQDTPLRFNLAPGEYRYTLSDGAGCRDSALLNIAVQGLLPLSSSGTPVSCFGGSDGTLTVAALGAAAPVQYSWEPGGASTPSLTGLAAGLYTLNVSDAWGCTTSMMFEVDEPDSLQFEGLVQDATNLAPMGGSILLDPITGGTPPYNLAWDNGSTANPLQNLAPGEYRVSVRDSKNCLSEWTYMVDLITSSGEPQAGSGLFLFPNPARSLVWIQGDLAPGTLLQVFDIQGRMVKELIYQPGQGLEVGDLAAGTYQVRNAECGMEFLPPLQGGPGRVGV